MFLLHSAKFCYQIVKDVKACILYGGLFFRGANFHEKS